MPLIKLAAIFAVISIYCTMPDIILGRSDKADININHHQLNPNRSAGILFSSYRNGKWEIRSMNQEGANLSQLTHMQEELHYPSWSSDYKKFVCATNEKNILIIAAGKMQEKLENIPSNCNHPSWSPDGKRISFACYTFENRKEDSDIWVYDIQKKKAEQLVRLENIQSFPAWSPDGRQLVFTTGYRDGSSQIIEELWVINSDGTDPNPIVKEGEYNIQPAWSPDGKKIAFASNRSGNMEIWVVDPDGQNAEQLTFDDSYDVDPSWSPDGTHLCFTSTRSGRMEIWVMDSDGKNPKQLTGLKGESGESMQPSWQN